MSANGAARQIMDATYQCGLNIEYSRILSTQEHLADLCVAEAAEVARGPHAHNFDNINISTSIFVEQRTSGPAKVQSGTFAIIYKLLNAPPSAMELAPMEARAKVAPNLRFNHDIRPTQSQQTSFNGNVRIHIIKTLIKFCHEFHQFSDALRYPELQYKARRKLPAGYKTECFPLRVSTINEATVDNQPLVVANSYEEQMKIQPEELENLAIPSYNDQFTNAKMRASQVQRQDDVNGFFRMALWKLGIGFFHFAMNHIWSLLHIHRGSLHDIGSLTHLFAIMDKTRLGGQHPDYHSLLAALEQIFHGIILNAWRRECGYSSIEGFAASNPSEETLLEIAQTIIFKHATPSPQIDSNELEDSEGDIARDNLKLLLHDLCHTMELIRSLSAGDIGRVEDTLGNFAMMFRGAGSNNYCAEILHYIHNSKYVWTPAFA